MTDRYQSTPVDQQPLETASKPQASTDPESMTTSQLPALFLDRDGVIIENRANYVRSWSDVSIFPQALTALSRLRQWSGKIIIVTNQSVVGRGLITRQRADRINERLVAEITRAGGRIDAVYMCPHAPADNCDCRKPKPGLLTRAAEHFNIDMQRSIMIGDALTDIAAARAAGVNLAALVRTGLGRQQLADPENVVREDGSFPVYDNLLDAIQSLFSQ